MKVLFFEPYALALPHYETALELMQLHVNSGDQILFYGCNANLSFCEANPTHTYNLCEQCIGRRNNGVKLIHGNVQINGFKNLTATEIRFIRDLNLVFEDIESLKSYRYFNIDMGMAVASSLISQLRDPEPDMKECHHLLQKILRSAFTVYFSFNRILSNQKPDIVYIFNGRFSNLRVVLRLCQQMGIECRVHERGSDKKKYSIISNHLPHEISPFVMRVEFHWQETKDPNVRDAIAHSFYINRRNGVEQGWYSFTKEQEPNRLPDCWDDSKRNILIFNSSEDEFAAIGSEFHCKPFKNQLDSLKFIQSRLITNESVRIYLRIHPNLKGVTNSSVTDLYGLESENFIVIAADSPISTYTLIDACDLVLTFGSTVGVESTYWRKPSLLIGSTFYQSFNVVHQINDEEDLIEKLLTYNEVKPIDGCLKYAYYLANHGIPFTYYCAEELFKGKFKKVLISGRRNRIFYLFDRRPFVYFRRWVFNKAAV